MTWLLLDCGNSAIKWAIAKATTESSSPAWLDLAGAGRAPLTDDWAASLRAGWRHRDPPPVAAFGCSVAAPAVAQAIDALVRDMFGITPNWRGAAARFVGAGTTLDNGYREPARLGADRWHALIAARVAAPAQPLLVVNAGTATTVDAVSSQGRFEGGTIAPGVELMRDSLARGTARLPRAHGHWVELPDGTDDAIETGIVEAQVGLVERQLRRHAARSGAPIRMVLAGGHARLLMTHLDAGLANAALSGPPVIEDNLVLRGVLLRARTEPSPVKPNE